MSRQERAPKLKNRDPYGFRHLRPMLTTIDFMFVAFN